RASTLLDSKLSFHGGAADRSFAGVPEAKGDRVPPLLYEPAAGAAGGGGGARPPLAEARGGRPGGGGVSTEPFHFPCELPERCKPEVVGERHGIGHTGAASRRRERGLEHTRVVLVAPFDLVRLGRLELERAASAGVEDAREDGRRVDIR